MNNFLAKTLILTFLSIQVISCNHKKTLDDSIMQEMFCSAFEDSIYPKYYIVITVKNINTEETKEICTDPNLLLGAISIEKDDKNLAMFNYKDNKHRYFIFSNEKALNNINYYLYSDKELQNYKKTINVDNYVCDIKSHRRNSKEFDNYKEQLMFSHIMFKQQILTRRTCRSGNFVILKYYENQKI